MGVDIQGRLLAVADAVHLDYREAADDVGMVRAWTWAVITSGVSGPAETARDRALW